MGIKIDDLVAPEAKQALNDFLATLESVNAKYVQICQQMIHGINIKVTVIGDLDKLDAIVRNGAREYVAAGNQMQAASAKLNAALGNTTNTISRALAEQEKINRQYREAAVVTNSWKAATDAQLGTMQSNVSLLVYNEQAMKALKEQMREVEQQEKNNAITHEQALTRLTDLKQQYNELKIANQELQKVINNEEKANQATEGSYKQLSLELERMKMAYKDMSEEQKQSAAGQELLGNISVLDAHLKDLAADMGEFQRNVGNYAIAANAGVRDTTALQQALDTEAKTAKEAAEQNVILRDALQRIQSTTPNARDQIDQLTKKIQENERVIQSNQKASTSLVDQMLRMAGVNSNLGSSFSTLSANAANGGNVMTGLTTKVKAFGSTLMTLLANPVVLAFLGIAGVAAAGKWWYDYNKGLIEASRQTKFFTGLTGDAMSAVRDKVQAVADTYGKDFNQTLTAATSISHNMGVTVDEALDLINKGFAAGGVNSENYLNILKRFAPTMEKMGLSADQFVAFAGQIEKAGADTNKSMTAMGKASMQLRTMNIGTANSLKAIGINATQMSSDIQTGKKSVVESMQEIAQKIQETGTNSREVAAVMKDLFGARGESQIGTEFISFLAEAKTGTEELLDAEDSLQRLKVKEVETQTELNNIVASLFEMGDDGFAKMTTNAKIWIKQGLINAIKWVVNLINYFIDWYNESLLLRVGLNNIITQFKVMWEVVKLVFNLIIDAVKNVGRQLKAFGDILEGIITFDADKIKKGWNDIFSSVAKYVGEGIGDIRKAGSNIGDAFMDGMDNAINSRINKIDVSRIGNADTDDGYGGGSGSGGTISSPTHAKDPAAEAAAKAAAKAAEKQRQQDLKAEEAILEAKLELEKNYHKKEMMQIELQWTKKINAIKGDGEKERIARLNLQKAMLAALYEAEYNYQQTRAKIDLENRLASVKEGSEEEYNLKLEQLKKQRESELREAERTDADVALINAKYDKQERDLLESQIKNRIDKLTEAAATEQVIRDNTLKQELNTLNEQMAEELRLAGNNEQKIADIKDKYARLTAEKQEQYALETAKKQMAAYMQQLQSLSDNKDVASLFSDLQDVEGNAALLEGLGMAHADALNMAKQLASAEIDIANAEADAEIAAIERVNDADKKARDKRIANAEKWLNAAADALGNITDLVSTLFDGQIAKIEEQQEANQAQYDAQIANIEQLAERGAITQEEAELRKREAEAATAKREEELAKKKAKAEYKQAVAEKANNISQIGIATALGIMKASPNWVNMALVAAMGAIQLATAIAQPIKAYKRGTDYHPGGLAVVGDGGKSEVVESNGKYWLTPKVPTLVTMPEGAKVYPDIEKFINEPPVNYGDLLAALPLPDLSSLLYGDNSPQVIVNNDYRALQRDVQDLGRLLKAMIKQQSRDAAKARYDQYRRDMI